MAVWGIGAYFQKDGDITKKCLENGVAVTGFKEDNNPKLFEMMRQIQAGDLIFIKSRFMKNQPLRVKAIGIVKDSEIKPCPEVLGTMGIEVHWLKDLSNEPEQMEKEDIHDRDTHTLYQEKNEKIIKKIIELL